MATNYISSTETAKLVRAALKESFPGFKFKVNTDKYSMGSSIRVNWTDGPTAEMVDSVVKIFAGSYFDGSIDYKGNRYVMIDGVSTSFGADYISTTRSYSDELETKINAAWARKNFVSPDGDSLDFWKRQFRAKFNCFLAPKHSKLVARIIYIGNDGYSQTGALSVE